MVDQSAAVAERLLSAEEYFELEKHSEERHEFHHGKLLAMPGESLDANQIGTNCHFFLEKILENFNYRIFRLSIKLRILDGKLYRYPDVMVVPTASIHHTHEVSDAVLIIGIASEESANRDRKTKLKEYTEHFANLQHYLIIDQYEPSVEMYSRRDGAWVYESFDDLDAEVPLRHFEARLPLRTVYKKVAFGESKAD
jgi:Uma2 family endonuclease